MALIPGRSEKETVENALVVGKSLRDRSFLARVIVTVALLAMALLLDGAGDPAFPGRPFWWLTVVSLGLTLRQGLALWRQWRTLVILPEGFIIEDGRGRRTYRDDQVVSLALFSQTNFAQGLPDSLTQQLRLWLDEGGRYAQVDLELTHPVAVANPFAELEQRLADRLTAKARAVLEAGREVVGEGWKLGPAGLQVQTPSGTRQLDLDQVADLGVFDHEVCLWRKDEDEPYVRIPARSMNALLLERLVREKRGEALGQVEGTPSTLGRVLFERKIPAGWSLFWGFCAVLGLLAAVGTLVGSGESAVAAVVAGVSAVPLLLALWVHRWRFRCHQFGVSQRGLLSEGRLMYRDMASFTYQTTRMFYNGVYTGTTIQMVFGPVPGPGRQTITFQTTLQGLDEELDNLRQHIAKVIAHRLIDELKAERSVDWTPNLRFLPNLSLEYRAPGLLWGSHEPVVIPLATIVNVGFDAGYFHIWVQGQEKSVVQEQASSTNFWPGFYLLSALLEPLQAAAPSASSAPSAASSGEEQAPSSP